jgi:hypothetical protein
MGLKTVHVGAGNVGRGFVAESLHKVCFIAVLLEVANNSGSLDMRWFLQTSWTRLLTASRIDGSCRKA